MSSERTTSSTALAIRAAGNLPAERWTDERIAAIKTAVTPGKATTAQLAIFLATAHRYDLDPLLGEIWLADMQGTLRVVTGRDAYVKVASREKGYKGFASGVVYSNDEFAVQRDGAEVKVLHTVKGFDRGHRLGAYFVGYHEGRPSTLVMRAWSDYASLHNKPTWKAHPDTMIETRVIVTGFKFMYNIAGISDEDGWLVQEIDGGSPELAVAGTRTMADDLRSQLADAKARKSAAVTVEVPAELPEPEPDFVVTGEDEEISDEALRAEEAAWMDEEGA